VMLREIMDPEFIAPVRRGAVTCIVMDTVNQVYVQGFLAACNLFSHVWIRSGGCEGRDFLHIVWSDLRDTSR
jgi:hypothetical protein